MIYLTIKFIDNIINNINLTFKLGIDMIYFGIKALLLPLKLIKF